MRAIPIRNLPVGSQPLTEEERAYYSLNRRVYRLFAPFYDLVTLPARALRREVVRLSELPPASRILDVATGTGAQALAFAQAAKEVVGVDLSRAMLRVARRKNRFQNVSFQEADGARLPFEEGSFDAACVSFALHEMPESIRTGVLREMARVTRPGGLIVLVDYALPRGRLASWVVFRVVQLFEGDHYASLVRSDLAAFLRGAGIEPLARHLGLGGLAQIVTGRRPEQKPPALGSAG